MIFSKLNSRTPNIDEVMKMSRM